MTQLRFSPLDGVHRELSAKMVEFGGWDMPVSYPSGTISEHLSCRTNAVVFDVSHLGTVRVEGYYAKAAVQNAFTNDIYKIGVGQTQYTHLLNDQGGVLDDIIVWWVSEDRFDVMPNASNTDQVLSAVGGVDVTSNRAVLAVQGPNSRNLIAKVDQAFGLVARNNVAVVKWRDVECVVAGTGYTGESGIEIAVPISHAEQLWRCITAEGITPAGLGARDTLRLESGLPLHGHELSPKITPLEAKMAWVVSWDKSFPGRDALVFQKQNGISRHLVGVTTSGRRPPRDGCDVLVGGLVVGHTTSGNFSPVLQHGIALALVDMTVQIGHQVTIDVRGSHLEGKVVKTPFIAKK